MNKVQKRQKRREQRLRARARAERKRCELEQVDEMEEIDEPELSVSETAKPEEEVEKDIYPDSVMPVVMVPGPTSFEELDAEETARDQAEAIQEVVWDTKDLVHNILYHPDLDPEQKAEAMRAVADEFASRVATELEEETEKDMDLLELEAIIAQDKRTTTALEYLGDITKAVLSTATRNNLDDSKFALVVTRGGKKVRKYPIHDKAHVRNALARAAQMIKRGGQAASDARSALPKIRTAAKKMGIGANMDKERNAILIEKDNSGNWRWVGWVSNNRIDWDGDIISEAAHKEYVEWWEKNKDLSPAFLTWHTPGTARENPVDFVMYENGFLIMSGLLTEKEAAGLLRAQTLTELGMSHGTLVFGRDPKDVRVISKYRMYEASDLSLEYAANPFTDFETLVKEVGMNLDKKAYLVQILGEEKAEAFLKKTEQKKADLDAAGIESKETVDVTTEVVAAPPDQKPEAPVQKPEEIVAQVMKEMDVDGLNAFVKAAQESMEKVPVLEGVIKEMQAEITHLKGEEEDKLAAKLTPPASRFAWTQAKRASQAEDTVVGEDDEDAKHKPGVPDGYWLSDVTGTAPIPVEAK